MTPSLAIAVPSRLGAAPAGMSREGALAEAHKLVPNLRARALDCVKQRRAPVETIEDLKRSGLLRLLQPRRHGGHELGWDVFCEVIEILARGCGSQGWVYRVLGDHGQMLGIFPEAAQREVWGEDQDALASSSFAPVGKGIAVEGGYRFSGRHGFSSGIDHGDWVICGGRILESETATQGTPSYFLVRKSEGTVIDDWFVNGLEGTGSKSFEIKDVFVPTHRVLDWSEAALGTAPGATLNDAPIFRLPRGGYTTTAFAALAVGMARSMLDDWLTGMANRRSEGILISGLESSQITAAQAHAEISAAEAAYLALLRETMRRLAAGEVLPPEETPVARSTAAFSCQLVLAAANRLHAAMGSSAVYAGSMMEVQFRNILVGLQHLGVNWPRAASGHGAQLFREHGAPLPPLSGKTN